MSIEDPYLTTFLGFIYKMTNYSLSNLWPLYKMLSEYLQTATYCIFKVDSLWISFAWFYTCHFSQRAVVFMWLMILIFSLTLAFTHSRLLFTGAEKNLILDTGFSPLLVYIFLNVCQTFSGILAYMSRMCQYSLILLRGDPASHIPRSQSHPIHIPMLFPLYPMTS